MPLAPANKPHLKIKQNSLPSGLATHSESGSCETRGPVQAPGADSLDKTHGKWAERKGHSGVGRAQDHVDCVVLAEIEITASQTART